MITGKQGKVDGIGYGLTLGSFVFAPNGASNPTSITGPLARLVSSITYSATGIFTIVFTSDFVWPNTPAFVVTPAFDAIANYFSANQVGAYNATTRTLVVQAHRAGTGYAAAAAAGCAINVAVIAQDSTGK